MRWRMSRSSWKKIVNIAAALNLVTRARGGRTCQKKRRSDCKAAARQGQAIVTLSGSIGKQDRIVVCVAATYLRMKLRLNAHGVSAGKTVIRSADASTSRRRAWFLSSLAINRDS